jgi:hypothetical protein
LQEGSKQAESGDDFQDFGSGEVRRVIQALPGFRDFYPEDCARRNHIVAIWRGVAKRYGFVEFDGPVLESTDLYRKKNEEGAEILEQLYSFADRGGREVALRPEMTPTLARMVAAREKHYRKPMKWFCVSNFFRHERQQQQATSEARDAQSVASVVMIVRKKRIHSWSALYLSTAYLRL